MAAFYTFEDYSGSKIASTSENPYDGLIESCHNSTRQQRKQAEIQAVYDAHRTKRAASQREKLLSSDFTGVVPDIILAKREGPDAVSGYVDPRNCLVFWARPPRQVRDLIFEIQKQILQVAPDMWVMPQMNLHMTALEIVHSLTAPEIDALVETMMPHVREIADYTSSHRARLVKPMISYDAQALALSFLPANGESSERRPSAELDAYSYHHLRRDVWTQASAAGVKVASRYVVPSAHLTIARFINKRGFEIEDGQVDRGNVRKLVERIEEINRWLEDEYWPRDGGIKDGGEWIVGEEKGLDFHKGTLWYGAGEGVYLGQGF